MDATLRLDTTIPTASAYDIKYCSLCDAYFYSAEMLRAHVQGSSRHAQCTTCNKRYLNKNSLRNVRQTLRISSDLQHFVLSSKHHYCRICDKHLQTPAGLDVHMDFYHLRRDIEGGGPSSRVEGWEDKLALDRDQALYGGEIPIPEEDLRRAAASAPKASNAAQMSGIATRVAILNLRAQTTSPCKSAPTSIFRPTCPICLSARKKKMCATRCGHVFCNSCITHALDETQSCPSCRQPASLTNLRPLDLGVPSRAQ
ncbi:RING-type domain-containing protein [Favolaschia claudopus]|uniref:RING-type domain-containing protein n=1 Tax=Favolaschia claudopus TaxID=2862362 RepID=A0AAW0C7M1_9AGAR